MKEPPTPPMASTRSDLRHLRDHSQATVAELKAFLREMKGRSPQEMLGMVAGNPLIRATGQSAVLVILILLVGTAIPYLTREAPDKPVPVPAEPLTPAMEPVPDPPADPAPVRESALENLGVGDGKSAPANENPLDTDTGSFLDELE